MLFEDLLYLEDRKHVVSGEFYSALHLLALTRLSGQQGEAEHQGPGIEAQALRCRHSQGRCPSTRQT